MVLLVNRAGKKTSYFIMTLTNIGNYISVILLCVLFAVHLTVQGGSCDFPWGADVRHISGYTQTLCLIIRSHWALLGVISPLLPAQLLLCNGTRWVPAIGNHWLYSWCGVVLLQHEIFCIVIS